MSDFLPQSYIAPKGGGGNYLKFSPGQTRFRIISNPVMGFVGWATAPDGGRKPIRSRMGAPMPPKETTPKAFWAVAVLHGGEIKIAEIVQKTLMVALESLTRNPDWGHPSHYDVVIERVGTDLNTTRYTLQPCPVKALDPAQIAMIKAKVISLESLFEGEDPFAGTGPRTELLAYDGLPF